MTGLVTGALGGAALGALYFGGLWLTLRRVETARRPAALVAGSYLARLGVAALGFGWLASRGIGPVAAGLLAFVAVRTFLIGKLGPGLGVEGS